MTNTVATFSGLFKEVYADKMIDLIPDGVKLIKKTKFVEKEKQNGNSYHQPVMLTHEGGFTYEAASAGAFSINSAIAATHKDASITGNQLLLETRIDYETCARASEKGKKSFVNATSHIVENMMKSFYKRLEIEAFWGGNGTVYSGLGRLSAQTGSSTTRTWTIKTGDWAPGIWGGTEGSAIDVYDNDGAGGLPSTKLNTNADVLITLVDYTNKKISVSGNATDLSGIDTAIAAGDVYLYWKGAFGKEFVGLVQLVSNTGTLFGIAGASYGLWQGNSYAVSGSLTFAKTLAAHDVAVGKGLASPVTVYLNPATWTDVMSDLAALRKFDSSYSSKKFKNGAEEVEFFGQFGGIELVPSIYMKEGVGMSCPGSKLIRLGATDMTFNVPGMEKEQFLYQLPSNAGYALRAYANQALFLECPGHGTLLTGITNS